MSGLLLTLIGSKWHVKERQTWLSSDLVDIDQLIRTLWWSEWLCDIDRQWLCPEVKCKEEWHVVILSLLTSFLTWNVKRIQDTCSQSEMQREWHVVILSFSTSFLTWNVNGIQDTLFPKWKWKDWYSQYRQHLDNKGKEWIGGEVGWNNELSPKEGSARHFFVFQIPSTSTATWDIEMVAGD